MITAKEFIDKHFYSEEQTMIEFAKLHVKAALEAAAENAETIDGWNTGFSGSASTVNKESILNAYPDSNIK